ncbi:MAG: organic solvent tolerance protein OstA [Flavobacteriaceae bacterium CG_4_8_14_3_um_filter_34_10]|nr:LPS-assembly protein LptD [Flavobacteriia bacterium]PIQ17765.1 MAG: organic solvent tolerance protein OstA [Flavobacteriaceae bacterium CG18_big_fil_WC_8_21_14_2_50_34_36]PIV50030.1 MAG: organic solvent tolerance protein OstA [Flavobacteriaceae bacterium CG02_land_8_20_14_3_00_34_13]PIX09010.1 MAG: organic solvent tolerance protein OstA [Flavobacteriaceae bacterium CG_4_8_14_3_um_filter_34_10]PIZ08855.1 MAG: organic solvent tolerance protein OstA [Flavobacteriaceae bacterium CG_4_10_14_0_8_u
MGFKPLQTNKLRLLLLLCFSLMGLTILHAQEPKINPSASIPAVKDSVKIPVNEIFPSVSEIVTDTIKTDTIKPQKETLTGVVDYYGEDYVLMHKKENKVYMYNKAYIIYEDMRIDAGLIILDYNKNEVYAKGIKDSLGNYTQKPIFVQGNNKVEPDSIRFNFDSQRALVYNSRTEQSGFKVIGEISKKENDSVIFIYNVKFTTAKDIDNPEYYFFSRKVKFVPKKKIITGLTNMYIANVPTPIGLPFGYFPLEEDRASGFIIPTIGENNNRGFFFQNGGYYFALSDYADLTVLGDYYTNGSYGLRFESNYALRYRFRGNLSLRFENLLNSERGFPDFSESSVYNIRWSHTQDAKANPSSRFSASVNLGSSTYYQQSINQLNTANFLNNTLSSSVSYSKTFEGEPQVNLNIAGTHSQNTNTQEINLSLPNLTASVSRIFPFAPKIGVKKGAIHNINFQYDVAAENRIRTTDSLFFKPEMFNEAQIGARHTIPLSTNFKMFKYLSASAGTSYQEIWVLKTTERSFDAELNQVVIDTVNGFDSYRTYNFSTSLGTTVYGMFNFGKEMKIQSVRHVMRPSVGYSLNPGFNQYYEELKYRPNVAGGLSEEQILKYSRFQNTLYGAPNQNNSSSVSFGLSNTLEAKIRDKDSTATELKRISILNNLNFNTSYSITNDSLKWSPLNITGSIPIIPKLDINFGGILDPYALDNNNQKINTFNINNGGSLFRLTSANMSFNYSFSSKDFDKKEKNKGKEDNETFRNGGRPDDLFGNSNDFSNDAFGNNTLEDEEEKDVNIGRYNYNIPWDFRLAYTITYSNLRRENEISSQSLMFSGNMDLSPRWSVGASSGYDFKLKGFTFTQFRFQRDLESWQMSFNWVPFSAQSSWYFFVGIKSSVLSDIKYDKRRERDQQL